jgi:hypothetical protein
MLCAALPVQCVAVLCRRQASPPPSHASPSQTLPSHRRSIALLCHCCAMLSLAVAKPRRCYAARRIAMPCLCRAQPRRCRAKLRRCRESPDLADALPQRCPAKPRRCRAVLSYANAKRSYANATPCQCRALPCRAEALLRFAEPTHCPAQPCRSIAGLCRCRCLGAALLCRCVAMPLQNLDMQCLGIICRHSGLPHTSGR